MNTRPKMEMKEEEGSGMSSSAETFILYREMACHSVRIWWNKKEIYVQNVGVVKRNGE